MCLWSSLGEVLRVHGIPKGIEANLEKVRAILDMTLPKTVKEVQKLTGRIAAFNKFISKVTDKCLPFFKSLKQAFA